MFGITVDVADAEVACWVVDEAEARATCAESMLVDKVDTWFVVLSASDGAGAAVAGILITPHSGSESSVPVAVSVADEYVCVE